MKRQLQMVAAGCTTLAGAALAGHGTMHGGGGMGPGGGTVSNPAVSGDPNFADAHYAGSGNCVLCHDNLTDAAGNDISIVKAWSGSMMANSTRDPYWRAKVASERKRHPDQHAAIDQLCSRCHAPMASDAAAKEGGRYQILGDLLTPASPWFNHAMEGVSCTLCHQIADGPELGTPAGSSGAFRVESFADAVDRPAFGQYADPFVNPMQMNVAFTPRHGSHLGSSQVCASCHDLRTHAAESGSGLPFPEQMVFSEWSHSVYRDGGPRATPCQGCHMPAAAGSVRISNRPMWLPARTGFRLHDLAGANLEMQAILAANAQELGVLSTTLEESMARTRELLGSAARVEILSAAIANGVLETRVRITNLSGHKLPSGYPSRRVWLHLRVTDNRGTPLFESGRPNADGSIAGLAADGIAGGYEPHHEVIDAPGKVQIYEPVMADAAGGVTHSLLAANAYLKDNRLPPAGFRKAQAADEVAVIGAAQADPDFDDGTDTVTYRVPVSRSKGINIAVNLNYQALGFAHLKDLLGDAELAEVAAFKRMFEARPVRFETIASATRTVR